MHTSLEHVIIIFIFKNTCDNYMYFYFEQCESIIEDLKKTFFFKRKKRKKKEKMGVETK
jgi:hypothetical protein